MYKQVNVNEVATVERAVKGKEYKNGCILVALSATKGDLEKHGGGEVDSRYAIIIPNEDVNTDYLYEVIKRVFMRFITSHRTGINLKYEELKHLEFKYHPDRETQDKFAEVFNNFDDAIQQVEKTIEENKKRKKWLMKNMFV